MDLSVLTISTILVFLLMLIRITGMLVASPFFGQMGVPVQVQVALAVTFSIILYPVYAAKAAVPVTDLWQFAWIGGVEFVIGMLIGFVANLVFAAVQLAGHHVTMQMGLSIAHVVDPISQQQAPIMAQFYFIMAILLFMALNMHHSLILAVARSFDSIPVASGAVANLGVLTGRFMALAAEMFVTSLMLILPILGMMLLMEISLAFTAKIMPQMNIFMVSLPIKVGLSLILMYLTLPFTVEALSKAYEQLAKHLVVLYQL